MTTHPGDDEAGRVAGVVRVVRILLPAGDLAPEPRLTVRIGTVDGDAVDVEHSGFPSARRPDGGSVRREPG